MHFGVISKSKETVALLISGLKNFDCEKDSKTVGAPSDLAEKLKYNDIVSVILFFNLVRQI